MNLRKAQSVVKPPKVSESKLLSKAPKKMTSGQKVERQDQLASAHLNYHKSLNAYASYKLSDSVLSQDLVQDTFIKTWNYLMKKGEIKGMKSFLYHVLNNLIVDEYRKRKRKTVSLDVLLENGFAPNTGESESIKNQNIFDGSLVVLLIKKLPISYQEVIRMRYEQDLSLKEMSVIMKETENTVSVRLHRGIQKLRLLHESHDVTHT
ncbi:MAG: RNA polymerase sigma factor [Candidatus Pacebacteria bacterium]|nr:RNA polymerase sigma factor [Candidatus Paceibacterota bacterium]